MKQFLTESEVSELTGLSIHTLRNHRFERRGFSYVKFGKSVRYRLEDINSRMESHLIQLKEV